MAEILLEMLIAALVGIASYNLACYINDVPTGQTSKMMILAGRREGTRKENLSDIYIAKVAGLFSRFIQIDPLKRSQLENALEIADIRMAESEDEPNKVIDGLISELTEAKEQAYSWRRVALHLMERGA